MRLTYLLPLAASTLIAAKAAAGDAKVAVEVARATDIPNCTVFVDSAGKSGDGSLAKPHKTIGSAVEAADEGAVICVAQGTYTDELKPGTKGFTLAGGFKSGSKFQVRDSAKYASVVKGRGSGSFLRIEDPGPKGDQLTAIDGFEITGYSQAIYRQHWEPQRFDITNNFIHDNKCTDESLWGAGFALNNVSGSISGNVFRNNSCGRGGAGTLNDDTNKNSVTFERNWFDGNSGTEPTSAHGGGLHIGANKLTITANLFTGNRVTQWGGGLYVGAYTQGNQLTTAKLAWNVYRANRAGDSGGGFFCDEGATCTAEHEVYEGNCGGNVLVDGGAEGSGPTTAKFDHITIVGALTPDCSGPGIGFWADTWDAYAPDNYKISNALFWGNAPGKDIAATCGHRCAQIKLSIDNSMLDAKPGEGIKITYGGNISKPKDPQFVDVKGGKFRLRSGSPALGKGNGGSDLGALGEDGSAPPPALGEERADERAEPGAPVAEKETDSAVAEPPPKPHSPKGEDRKTVEAAANSGSASVDEKLAFDAAKELGTVDAWQAFVESFPNGFYSKLARAYLKKLGVEAGAPAAKTDDGTPNAKADKTEPGKKWEPGLGAVEPGKPAVARGGMYMGFKEQFNRFYTDPSWTPSQTLFVSPDGAGDGSKRDAPMPVADAIAAATAGTKIVFTRGEYSGCFEMKKEQSGTYDAPILLYGERNDDGTLGVAMTCCASRRHTCFNFEDASYVAVDGFELIGGKYGVRAIGIGYDASKHSRGISVTNCTGHDQSRDPFFSGAADWAVWEGNVAYGAKKEDGHGIYLSNGSDWNIVRFNVTHSNLSSDFQVNADPNSTCKDEGVAFDDPICDAYAGEGGEGGRGASDYFLVDSNYFHRSDVGPNFTSVRRSVVRNNVFGPQTRHNVSFWQETDNPKLGSSDNKVLHNLFITTNRLAVQFIANSTRNEFANNVLLGIAIADGQVSSNPAAVLMEVDDSVGGNAYNNNLYVSGRIEGREVGATEQREDAFSSAWFKNFPGTLKSSPNDFTPTAKAPFRNLGKLLSDAPRDRNGRLRDGKVDLGPIEID